MLEESVVIDQKKGGVNPVRILNLIPPGDTSGWGVCGSNLLACFLGMPAHVKLVAEPKDCDAVLCPVVNNRWGYHPGMESLISDARAMGKPVVGYGFHEFRLRGSQDIHWLPKNYTALACGSNWMYEWVQSALVGVADDFPLAVIHQGVNRQMFEPMPVARPDNLKDKFVVLSSGKFEMRKGQDVVVEAFRRFRKEVPSAVLSFAWDNLWTESMLSMTNSKYMDLKDLVCTEVNGNILISGINHDLIPRENQAVWRIGPNNQMVYFYNHADLAVFPNRCEAGQTLPALEAMACGLPCVIPEWTGMEDLVALTSGSPSVKVLKRGLQIKDHRSAHSFGFYEPCIDEVVSQMMAAYLEREKNKPNDLPKLMMSFEWRSTASGLVNLIRKVVK